VENAKEQAMIELFTIGFTQKNAERFFGLLKDNHVTKLVDIRLKPDVQLSGFARKVDLPYFMRELVGGSYLHLPELAPTAEIMEQHRSRKNWPEFASAFNALMDERRIPADLDRAMFEQERCCLLCSEHLAKDCHRTLVAERLATVWGDVRVTHLE
jgi:uncharacterized protein (DUF488 family)